MHCSSDTSDKAINKDGLVVDILPPPILRLCPFASTVRGASSIVALRDTQHHPHPIPLEAYGATAIYDSVFSVTRRYRSDVRQWVSEWVDVR